MKTRAENILFLKHLTNSLTHENYVRNTEIILNTLNENDTEYDFDIFEYIVDTFVNGNKTHAKEFYSELTTYQKQDIAYKFGLNQHSEIYNFITKI